LLFLYNDCKNLLYCKISSSKNEIIDDNKKFSYAGIYKSLHKGLYRDILCDDDPIFQDKVPYKKRIRINIKTLEEQIKQY